MLRAVNRRSRTSLVEVNRVLDCEVEAELRVLRLDVRDERVLRVAQGQPPTGVVEPGELAGRPYAETRAAAKGVILHAGVGIVDVAQ